MEILVRTLRIRQTTEDRRRHVTDDRETKNTLTVSHLGSKDSWSVSSYSEEMTVGVVEGNTEPLRSKMVGFHQERLGGGESNKSVSPVVKYCNTTRSS